MNSHAHPDPHLSDALASLRLAGSTPKSDPARRRGGRRWRLVLALTIAGSGVLLWQAAARGYLAPVGALPDRLRAEVASWVFAAATAPSAAQAASPDVAVPAPQSPSLSASAPAPPLPPTIAGSGHVVALAEAAVHARRGGTIEALPVDVGSAVEAGDVLARLDDPDLRFALEAALVARDRARLVLAARRLDADEARDKARRMSELGARGVVSGQTSRDAGTAAARTANLIDQAEEELDAADVAVDRAREAVSDLTLRAPIAGIVSLRTARLGEAILSQADARDEAPLFVVTDPHRLALDVDIAETALAAVRRGARGTAVLDAFPDRSFPVAVERIAPVASAEKGTIALRLTILDSPAGIRPAMAARVSLPGVLQTSKDEPQ
ncbi:efflux RND transporter periplasmic adaptor subunit [Segnochrobactrum spirostomi]|uniref:Efflux RND transporter periplasmic adaptor subunit n=1 Tax=Segnochrobactrum spirostomi TaxID=2608987 RepID=A0A6A7Y4R6_9HYPH|nr:efflux RND transporter periplasmic adaptor subunit [Segnochrobactrum spirostomi]MQT14144.1 efflux RND transporter periplasmic adaptor subunit [Segnochrobactrum spirostomi]